MHLQQQYGPDYPPETCVQYPRTPHRVDGLLEQPLLLSCIEAARLVLLNPQLLPPGGSGKAAYARFLAMPKVNVPHDPVRFRYFWDVRELCLSLVRERAHPLWERLFLLGMFSRRLGEIVGTRQFDSSQSYCANTRKLPRRENCAARWTACRFAPLRSFKW